MIHISKTNEMNKNLLELMVVKITENRLKNYKYFQ